MGNFGDFDGVQFTKEAKLKGHKLKPYLNKWIDFKKLFPPEELLKNKTEIK